MGLQEYDPCPRAKDAVVPFTSKMDFWNAEQTHCLEIQEAALPGRRDSREAGRHGFNTGSIPGPGRSHMLQSS